MSNKNRNHSLCKYEDSDRCILNFMCDDCWYWEQELICPYCERKVPNKEHFIPGGCKWCLLPKKS
jgi:hypothetical protein